MNTPYHDMSNPKILAALDSIVEDLRDHDPVCVYFINMCKLIIIESQNNN